LECLGAEAIQMFHVWNVIHIYPQH
jgi:hypothetical protein